MEQVTESLQLSSKGSNFCQADWRRVKTLIRLVIWRCDASIAFFCDHILSKDQFPLSKDAVLSKYFGQQLTTKSEAYL